MSGKIRKSGSLKKELKLLIIITVLVMITCSYSVLSSKKMINNQRVEISSLRTKIKEETNKKSDLQDQKKYMESDEHIEKVARDMLGLVKDNDIILKPEK